MKYPFNILEHPTGENIFNPTDKNKKDNKVRKCLKSCRFWDNIGYGWPLAESRSFNAVGEQWFQTRNISKKRIEFEPWNNITFSIYLNSNNYVDTYDLVLRTLVKNFHLKR